MIWESKSHNYIACGCVMSSSGAFALVPLFMGCFGGLWGLLPALERQRKAESWESALSFLQRPGKVLQRPGHGGLCGSVGL